MSQPENKRSILGTIILILLLMMGIVSIILLMTVNAKLTKDAKLSKTRQLEAENEIERMKANEESRRLAEEQKEIERKDKEKHLSDFYDTLTLKQRVGQLFIVAHAGKTVDKRAISLIRDRYIGGFCFYKKNAESREQTYGMVQLMQEEAVNGVVSDDVKNGIPLFIGGDNEPGRRWMSMSHLVKPLPLSKDIPVSYSVEDAGSMFSDLAKGLAGLGYNLDFAPVTDVHTNENNPIIGERSFSSNPDAVSLYASEFIKRFKAQGMITSAKHFPGHGDTSADSHKAVPRVTHDMSRINEVELKPFKSAIESNVDMIMTGHLIYEKLDRENPATFSKEIITGLLRKKMGYTGVVITDDMYMGAVIHSYDQKEALVKSINAGVDILLCVQIYDGLNTQGELYDYVLEAVKSGKISEDRLKESVMRILRLKSSNLILSGIWGDKNPVYLCDK